MKQWGTDMYISEEVPIFGMAVVAEVKVVLHATMMRNTLMLL